MKAYRLLLQRVITWIMLFYLTSANILSRHPPE